MVVDKAQLCTAKRRIAALWFYYVKLRTGLFFTTDKSKIFVSVFVRFIYFFTFTFMAKKSMIEREKKRQRLVIKYAKKRENLKQEIQNTSFLEEKLNIHRKLQRLPRNSAPVRLHNRCLITGRPKGYYRDFGLSRHLLREMAHDCLLPGVTKSSW